MTTSSFTILDPKKAHAVIKLISAAGKKMDERIHQVAVAGLAQYAEHGNTDVITELCHAMPKSSRGNALKFWVTKYSNLKWDKKAHGGKGGYVKESKAAAKEASIEEAIEHPFWEKQDTEQAVFNAESRVKGLLTAFSNALADGKITKDDAKKAKELLDTGLDALVA